MTTSFDDQGIREAITFYAEGMRTGDVETLKRARGCAKAIITVS